MRRSVRYALFAAAPVALLLAGVAFANPVLTRSLGLDLWNLPATQTRFAQEQKRGRELAALHGQIARRMAVKATTVSDLIEGRLSFDRSLERVRQLLVSNPQARDWLAEQHPGATADELAYRHLLGMVESMLEDDPAQCRVTVARLTKEWHDLRAD